MKNITFPITLVLFSLGCFLPGIAQQTVTEEPSVSTAIQWKQDQPVSFMENKGQLTDMAGNPVPFVLFKTSAPGMDMYITETGVTYVFLKTEDEEEEKKRTEGKSFKKVEWCRVDMKLQGAAIQKNKVITQGRSNFFSQYLMAHCPEGITDVRNYEHITIKDIYPGIDWVLYNSQHNGFKYDFIVHPGADYRQIVLEYSSLNPIKINNSGDLIIQTRLGEITENAPVSFLQGNELETRFVSRFAEKNELGGYTTHISFQLDQLDLRMKELPAPEDLVIDPKLLWSSFHGGNHDDGGSSIDCDTAGNVFITGETYSSDFPATDPGGGSYYQDTASGDWDGFILKFTNSGELLWSTYFGGNMLEAGHSIKTDQAGNVFVGGFSNSPNMPVKDPGGAYFQGTPAGSYDSFILKFSNAGVFIWGTYFGGTEFEWTYTLTVDNNDNVLLTGETRSTDLQVKNLAGAYNQPAFGGSKDAYIAKFDNSGALLWSTWYGGSSDETGFSITTDVNDNIYFVGATASTDFPLQSLAGAYNQPVYGGGMSDGFLIKFDNTGNRQWATLYGGSGEDQVNSVAADAKGNLFMSGITASADFPVQTATGAYNQSAIGGDIDAFIAKFDNSGNRQWVTWYGGDRDEYDERRTYDNLAIAPCTQNVTMTFDTRSNNVFTKQPCDGGFYSGSKQGSMDIIVATFTNSGEMLWSTHMGGDGKEFSSPVTIDRSGNIFCSGEWTLPTSETTYPLADPGGKAYHDATFNGGSDDAFILKFGGISLDTSSANAGCGCDGSATVKVNGNCGPFDYIWNNGSQSLSSSDNSNTIKGLCPGTYSVKVYMQCDSLEASFSIVGGSGTPPNLTVGPPLSLKCSAKYGNISASSSTAGVTFSWSGPGILSGKDSSTATVNSAGTYTVVATDSTGCTATDSVEVTDNSTPPDLSTGPSITLDCLMPDGQIYAGSTVTGVSFKWTGPGIVSGSDTDTLKVNQAGTYVVTVVDTNDCSSTDSVIVTDSGTKPDISIGSTPVLNCKQDSGTITATSSAAGAMYTWSGPGITSRSDSSTIAINSGGTYTVIVTDSSGCSNTKSVVVIENSTPPVVSAGVDIKIPEGSSTTLNASGGTQFEWSPIEGLSCSDCKSPVASPVKTTTYTVQVTDTNGCSSVDTVVVFVEPNCDGKEIVHIPTAFSPNGDSNNDVLELRAGTCLKEFTFMVFNRWGEKVFETSTIEQKWDGTFRGSQVASGVYAFALSAVTIDGERVLKEGNISVLP